LSEHTNTTPTQQCYRQLDASRQKCRKIRKMNDSIAERENKRKMAREEDAWIIAT